MSAPAQYHLQWRGQRFGPWDLATIREALSSGRIHSLYQIHVDEKWQPLRDFLENLHPSSDPVQVAAKQNETRLRTEYEAKLQDLQEKLEQAQSIPMPGRPPPIPEHLLRKPLFVAPPVEPTPPQLPTYHLEIPAASARTSGLAIASFVLSLLFFIPIVNLISWILSIIFGHIALVKIRNNPLLGGRGLAMAGLAITYGIIMIIIMSAVFMELFKHF
ncbi:uncharacterized protein DUF4190 [Prosthecobacter fusiformis]|uniref:Uncharacterized protein DUF4190 n=1 Tax=Prosthecobacter fusiformis TaxID=48464 RepID=A0A4R7SSR4_9BACT|nr:DUF4190 domain-containing protein [Prosthecobacter fusiformis]TDU81825.1 uncharacterized protein DUF4190 [Prosthecobacter fusiformis]